MPKSGDTILVVEDEVLIRCDIVDALEKAGLKVVEASNVGEAVAILGALPDIKAVFTDVDMPGPQDGLDLARAISSGQPAVKILVASGRLKALAAALPERSSFFSKAL